MPPEDKYLPLEHAHVIDDDRLLADSQAAFERMTHEPELLATYRAEVRQLADEDAPGPEW